MVTWRVQTSGEGGSDLAPRGRTSELPFHGCEGCLGSGVGRSLPAGGKVHRGSTGVPTLAVPEVGYGTSQDVVRIETRAAALVLTPASSYPRPQYQRRVEHRLQLQRFYAKGSHRLWGDDIGKGIPAVDEGFDVEFSVGQEHTHCTRVTSRVAGLSPLQGLLWHS